MAEMKEVGTVIGVDTVIKGEMHSDTHAKILGRFEGTITSKGQVTIADKAICRADVNAKIVQVDGGLEGNITAAEKVHLNATAKMNGDIRAVRLHIAEGASVDGHFQIGPGADTKESARSSKPAAVVEVSAKAARASETRVEAGKK